MNYIIIDNDKYYYNENNDLVKDNSKIKDLINNYEYNNYCDLNLDLDKWERKLNRKLHIDEKKMFIKVFNEKDLNKSIFYFKKILMKSNCFIKAITKNEGNCLFESLGSLGIGDNDDNINNSLIIRHNIASVLMLMENDDNFFPKLGLSPKKIFNNMNEIEFVKVGLENEVYEYNYDLMIYDLYSNRTWTRLPTELILMTISRIYNLKILIFHNKTHYISEINQYYDDDYSIVRLGLIGEQHYFPVLELDKELHDNPDIVKEILDKKIEYKDYANIFKSWSIIQNSINNQSNSGFNTNQNYNNISLDDFYII
jgi:hypothetical protein